MKYSKFAVAGCALVFSLILSLPLQGAEHRDVGLSQSGVRIEAAVVAGPSSEAPTVLLVGGLAGNDESVSIVEQEVRRLEAVREDRRQFQLIAISLANPDGNRLQFPPAGVAYRENTGSHVLWRWIGIHAPDLVIIASR